MQQCQNQQRRDRRGLTLIELLVSCVILGIGLVGLSNMYLAGMRMYLSAQYTSVAAQRAQYELERAQSLRFTVLQNSAHLINDAWYPTADGYQELSTQNGVEFDIKELPRGYGRITVSRFQQNPSLLLVEIFISWNGGLNTSSSTTVSTLLVK